MPDLSYLGLSNLGTVHHNLSTPALYEEAVRRREGWIAHLGPLVVRTGQYTGRSAEDKFIVEEPTSRDKIWWGKQNRPIAPEVFGRLRTRLAAYLQGRDVFVQDCYAGAAPEFRLKVRVVTENAWHSLFVRNMFIRELDRVRTLVSPQGWILRATRSRPRHQTLLRFSATRPAIPPQ